MLLPVIVFLALFLMLAAFVAVARYKSPSGS